MDKPGCEHPIAVLRICPWGGVCYCCTSCRELCKDKRIANPRAGNMRLALETIVRNTACGWSRSQARAALTKDDELKAEARATADLPPEGGE